MQHMPTTGEQEEPPQMVTGDLNLDTESKDDESVGGKAVLGKQAQTFLRCMENRGSCWG